MMNPKFQGRDLRATEIREWFERNLHLEKDHSYADVAVLAKAFALIFSQVLFYSLALNSENFWMRAFCMSVFGTSALMLVFNIGHDASHGAVFKSRSLNLWLCRVVFLVLGVDGGLWASRHIRSHHPYTNIPGADPDASAGEWLRLFQEQPHRWFHRYQVFYAPFLYFLALPSGVWGRDFELLFANQQQLKEQRYQIGVFEKMLLVLSKLIHISIWFVIPMAVFNFPIGQTFLIYLFATGLTSFIFVVLAALNHFSEFAEFPIVAEDGQMSGTWFEHQLKVNSDWSSESKLVCFLVGGANAHVAHHLFPQVSHRHLHALTQQIQDVTNRHQLPFYQRTFLDGVRSHFAFLQKMGNPK